MISGLRFFTLIHFQYSSGSETNSLDLPIPTYILSLSQLHWYKVYRFLKHTTDVFKQLPHLYTTFLSPSCCIQSSSEPHDPLSIRASIENESEAEDQSFRSLCEAFVAALGLGPCVILLDGVNELTSARGLSSREVSAKSKSIKQYWEISICHDYITDYNEFCD